MQRLGIMTGAVALAVVGVLGFVMPAPPPDGAPAPAAEASATAEPGDDPRAGAARATSEAARTAPAATADRPARTGRVRAAAGAAVVETAARVVETLTGSASYYADRFEGRTTASGRPFHQAEAVAAHRTLPFGTRLRVTNLANGRTVQVEVVDRGPFAHGRVLDLSKSVARELGFVRKGHTRVKIEVLERPD